MSEHRKLFKSAGIVGALTLLSRILGFLRDIIIARLFGTQMAAQAFVVAFRIPNTLRHLVGEGATNAAVIPVLSEYLANKDRKEFWHLVNVLLNLLGITLVLIAILGTILAPFIVRIIAFGFCDDAAKLELTVRLTRVIFSFIIFIGLAAYLMGVLNTFRHFAISAIGPCVLNITMIVFGLWICGRFQEPIMGLALAVLIGGFLQLAIQIPVLVKKGFRFHFLLQLHHPATKKIAKLLLPRMLGSSIYQLNIFADTIFASLGKIVGEGAVAALYYANRLIQFPTAIFGIAMATVCLPTMSQQALANDIDNLKNTLTISLRTLLVLLIPSSLGLFVLARPIVSVLFQRGQFDAASTQMTSFALIFYCVGIFAYSGSRLITTCFYALKDTITPVKITMFCLLLNAVLNFMLMWPLQVGGLALATSISSVVNFFILIVVLRHKIGRLGLRKLVTASFSVIICSVLMGVVCQFSYIYAQGILQNGLSLLVSIVAGIVVFIGLGWGLGIFKGFRLKI